MSETTPVTPDAERLVAPKRSPRGCLIAGGIVLAMAAYTFTFPLYPPGVIASMENRHSDWLMGHAFSSYAEQHDGELPSTLRALILKDMDESDLLYGGYHDEWKGWSYEWLYYPKAKLDGLPRDTIILAAPRTTFDFLWRPRRVIMGSSFCINYIPEADFQRLIREQNPPPAK